MKICLLAFLMLSAICRTVFAQVATSSDPIRSGGLNAEVSAFGGKFLNHSRTATFGANLGVGVGKNMVTFEASVDHMDSYAIGIGNSFYPQLEGVFQAPISDSKTSQIAL